jgi:hypothetical protein
MNAPDTQGLPTGQTQCSWTFNNAGRHVSTAAFARLRGRLGSPTACASDARRMGRIRRSLPGSTALRPVSNHERSNMILYHSCGHENYIIKKYQTTKFQ